MKAFKQTLKDSDARGKAMDFKGFNFYGMIKNSYESILKRNTFKDEFNKSESLSDRFAIIKSSYIDVLHEMELQHKRDYTKTISPYFLNWNFTPIEVEAWNQIRYLSNLALYPQYPVGRYFTDFANPFLKIVIEMDGADFHDENKDKKRDEVMKKMGWKVFRIPGNKCFKPILFEYENESFYPCEKVRLNNEKWFMQTCDGILTAISVIYFNEPFYDGYKEICAKTCLTYQS